MVHQQLPAPTQVDNTTSNFITQGMLEEKSITNERIKYHWLKDKGIAKSIQCLLKNRKSKSCGHVYQTLFRKRILKNSNIILTTIIR